MGGGSKGMKRISLAAQLIKSTTQIGIVARHHCGISAVIAQTLFPGETSDGVAKCRALCKACCNPNEERFLEEHQTCIYSYMSC